MTMTPVALRCAPGNAACSATQASDACFSAAATACMRLCISSWMRGPYSSSAAFGSPPRTESLKPIETKSSSAAVNLKSLTCWPSTSPIAYSVLSSSVTRAPGCEAVGLAAEVDAGADELGGEHAASVSNAIGASKWRIGGLRKAERKLGTVAEMARYCQSVPVLRHLLEIQVADLVTRAVG